MNHETMSILETVRGDTTDIPAVKAFENAASRLGVDADTLAVKCQSGALADVFIELRVARFNLAPHDQERVEKLLREIGLLP